MNTTIRANPLSTLRQRLRGPNFRENGKRADFLPSELYAITQAIWKTEERKAKERQIVLGKYHGKDPSGKFPEGGQDKIGDKKFYAEMERLITVIKADVEATLESSGLILKQLKESGKIEYVPVKKKD